MLPICNQSKNQELEHVCVLCVNVVEQRNERHARRPESERARSLCRKKYYTDLVLLEYLKATWDFRSEQHNIICNTSEIKIYTALKQKHRQSVTGKIVFNSLDCTSLSSERVFFVSSLFLCPFPSLFISLSFSSPTISSLPINTLGVGYSLVSNSNRNIYTSFARHTHRDTERELQQFACAACRNGKIY